MDLPLRIACVRAPEHAETPHPVGQLRARRERPTRRAAEQRDELAASCEVEDAIRDAFLDDLPGSRGRFQRIGEALQPLRKLGAVARSSE